MRMKKRLKRVDSHRRSKRVSCFAEMAIPDDAPVLATFL